MCENVNIIFFANWSSSITFIIINNNNDHYKPQEGSPDHLWFIHIVAETFQQNPISQISIKVIYHENEQLASEQKPPFYVVCICIASGHIT